MKKISIVSPVYNEEAGIRFFHSALLDELNRLPEYEFEIIYVVDKCKDNSLGILSEIAEKERNVIVIGLSRRFGHQMSLVAGLDACSGDACIMMDCDMEHPPSFIETLLKKYEEGFDVIHTRRVYSQRVGFFKRTSSKLFYKLLNKLSTEDLGQDSADFRLVSRKVIDVFNQKVREHNQYLRGLFRWVGFKQTEMEFQAGERMAGASNYRMKTLMSLATDGIVSFSKIPLRISIVLGVICATIGLVYGIYSVVSYFIDPTLPAGWTSTIIFLLLIGGILLLVLGIIGVYIGAIFDEVKNRPLYIVEVVYGVAKQQEKKECTHL
ncbi:glycosyltransferase family 2 protein [Christensenellaceae bacterium OttesenSCG-928-K19]|nr:glycosyltransferase family 2 protein [Christensenellaceae bacterium OttesenSCG-928-K19]